MSLFRLGITSVCLGIKGREHSCMISWMLVSEVPVSLSMGSIWSSNGFIAFFFFD